MARITQRIASHSDPLVAAREVLREALAATGAKAGGLFIPDQGRLVPLATSSPLLARDPGAFPSHVAAQQQALHVTRRDQLTPLLPPGTSFSGAIGAPLPDGRGNQGALVVFGDSLTGDAVVAVSMLADLAGLSLRLERAGRGGSSPAARSSAATLDPGRALTGVLDLEELLGRILDGAEQLLASIGSFVCLVDEDGIALRLGMFRWLMRDSVRNVMSHPSFRQVLRETAPRLVVAAADPVFAPLVAGSAEPVSLVIVPLRADGSGAGLLVGLVPDGEMFDSDRLSLVQSFADRAGLALVAAGLHQELGRKEGELSAIVASIDDPLLVVDREGRLLLANPAAEHLFGFAGDFIRGTAVTGRIPGDLQAFLMAGWGSQEFLIAWPEPRTFRVSVSPLRDYDHTTTGRVMVLSDVTSEREAEQIKSDFLAVIGHELRTPITVVKGFVRTLERRGDQLAPDTRRQTIASIAAQTHRLERLIEDLLFVAEIEKDRPALALERVDFVSLCRGVLVQIRPSWPGRHFHLETTSGAVMLSADPTKVEQIIAHLVDNALKYSTDDVWVRIFDADHEVRIDVVDRGIGIFSGDVARLFHRFGQIDGGLSRQRGGTGMGLYICKRLVEVHQGRIDVDTQLGKGSTFSVFLPRNPNQEADAGAPFSADAGTILYADHTGLESDHSEPTLPATGPEENSPGPHSSSRSHA